MATANAATSFLENRLLNFLFKGNAAIGGVTFGTPGDGIYVGLATAVSNFNDSTGESAAGPTITEADFNGYARKQVSASNWTLTSQDDDTQTIKNAQDIDFNPHSGGVGAGANADTITHVFIATHLTNSLDTLGANGNVLFIGKLDVDKTIQTNDIFRINQNNLTIELK